MDIGLVVILAITGLLIIAGFVLAIISKTKEAATLTAELNDAKANQTVLKKQIDIITNRGDVNTSDKLLNGKF